MDQITEILMILKENNDLKKTLIFGTTSTKKGRKETPINNKKSDKIH